MRSVVQFSEFSLLCLARPAGRARAQHLLDALSAAVRPSWAEAGGCPTDADAALCFVEDAAGLKALPDWLALAGVGNLAAIVVADLPEEDVAPELREQIFDWVGFAEVGRLQRSLGHAAALRTVRRSSEEARREWLDADARMAALADSIPGLVFQLRWKGGEDLAFLFAAGAPEQLLGVSAQQLVHEAGLFRALLDPADRAGFTAALAQSAKAGARINWEGRVTVANGDQKWINLRGTVRLAPDGEPVWEGVMLNITQGKRNEFSLRESRQRLAALSNHLQFAKEDERERIAREIHDVLGGHLVAVKFEASYLAAGLAAGSPLEQRVGGIGKLIDEAIDVVGRVTRELRPGILRDFGLPAALEAHAEDFSRRTGIECIVSCSEDFPDLPEASAIALFRIFQEALTNVLKHAGAGRVEALLEEADGEVGLEVLDDGRGIEAADLEKPQSFGLRGMQERIHGLGGEVSIMPGETGGTRLQVRFPLETESILEEGVVGYE